MEGKIEDFYAQLPVFEGFNQLTDVALYRPLPEDWVIGMSDVVGSTAAILAGQYKIVNIAGAALIAALSNALGRRDFPFAFGGDGASFALPLKDVETARAVLAATAAWVRDDLSLTLRVALIPVAAVRAAGWDVQVARYAPSSNVSYAMFTGGGLAWAEHAMKAGHRAVEAVEPAITGTRPDLTGLSCPWQEFPAQRGVVLSLIVAPVSGEDDPAFRELVADILWMTGQKNEARHPIADGLRALSWPSSGLGLEPRATHITNQGLARHKLGLGLRNLASWAAVRFGLPMGRLRPSRYIGEIVANADFRKYGDALRMTLDCTPKLVEELEARLRIAEQACVARFGLHQQGAAIVTCYAPSPTRNDHVHFVDGAAGGYAAAAAQLKYSLETGLARPAPAPGHGNASAPVVIALRHPENTAGQIRPPSPASQAPGSRGPCRSDAARTRSARPVMKAASAPTVGTRR
jgi:hypothetical protein